MKQADMSRVKAAFEDSEMSSYPADGYCVDAGDDVDMKPFAASLHVSSFH